MKSGISLNLLIEEKIFGWNQAISKNKVEKIFEAMPYSTDMSAAREIIDHYGRQGYHFEIRGCICKVFESNSNCIIELTAETDAMAVCLAALELCKLDGGSNFVEPFNPED